MECQGEGWHHTAVTDNVATVWDTTCPAAAAAAACTAYA